MLETLLDNCFALFRSSSKTRSRRNNHTPFTTGTTSFRITWKSLEKLVSTTESCRSEPSSPEIGGNVEDEPKTTNFCSRRTTIGRNSKTAPGHQPEITSRVVSSLFRIIALLRSLGLFSMFTRALLQEIATQPMLIDEVVLQD
ncbi:hypothetical protein HanIR_Chr14g0720741 [Helianthus annuus]|nr:hypothetical protein HanIR_Chr14g0720741 [Helianthus annuus]